MTAHLGEKKINMWGPLPWRFCFSSQVNLRYKVNTSQSVFRGCTSMAWELVKSVNSWLHPRTTERGIFECCPVICALKTPMWFWRTPKIWEPLVRELRQVKVSWSICIKQDALPYLLLQTILSIQAFGQSQCEWISVPHYYFEKQKSMLWWVVARSSSRSCKYH